MKARGSNPIRRGCSLLVAASIALLTGACASPKASSPDIPIGAAGREDLSLLVGKWTGEYTSPDSGRTGSIVFELKSGGATASGDVLMWPKGARGTPSGADDRELPIDTMPQVLKVQFVRAEGDRITGTLRPYVDPDCLCDVRTVFVGVVRGDAIEGTFTTERSEDSKKLAAGTWKVRRSP